MLNCNIKNATMHALLGLGCKRCKNIAKLTLMQLSSYLDSVTGCHRRPRRRAHPGRLVPLYLSLQSNRPSGAHGAVRCHGKRPAARPAACRAMVCGGVAVRSRWPNYRRSGCRLLNRRGILKNAVTIGRVVLEDIGGSMCESRSLRGGTEPDGNGHSPHHRRRQSRHAHG